MIGDEILKGSTIDTNSHFISKKLHELGVQVKKVGALYFKPSFPFFAESWFVSVAENLHLIYLLKEITVFSSNKARLRELQALLQWVMVTMCPFYLKATKEEHKGC